LLREVLTVAHRLLTIPGKEREKFIDAHCHIDLYMTI